MRRARLTAFLIAMSAAGAAAVDWAPFVHVQDRADAAPAWRALGPLFEYREREEDGSFVAALPRPVWTRFDDATREYSGNDVLWPLAVTRRARNRAHQRVLLALHTDLDVTDSASGERWWVLPVFFAGRNRAGAPYFAVFPLGGRIDDILTYDSLSFGFFPLFLASTRGHQHAVSVLWPVFSRTRGENLRKWRVFPLVGQSVNDGETRRFVLWPLLHTIHRAADESGAGAGRGVFLLPLAGRYAEDADGDTPGNRAWTVLWPFFSGATNAHGGHLSCPWPFVQFAASDQPGRRVRKRHFWPAYGTTERAAAHEWFALWPFLRGRSENLADEGERERLWVLPLYWSTRTHRQGETIESYRRFWPFFSTTRHGADTLQFRALDLWPQRNAWPIERNFAPFWTLYQYEQRGASQRHEALWGLFQRSRDETGTRIAVSPLFRWRRAANGWGATVLGGLLDVQTAEDATHGRLLWFIRW